MSAKFARAVDAARQLPDEELDLLADELAALVQDYLREERYRHARTLEGLRESERGEGFSEAEARERMAAMVRSRGW